MTDITVIGAGYVGLVTGVCLAELGHSVTCLEIDPHRLAVLRRGESPIHEPGLEPLMRHNCERGRLDFTDDYPLAIARASIVFLAVPTPAGPDGHADTSFVFAAVRTLLPYVQTNAIIVTKSTVPVGTGDEIQALVTTFGAPHVHVAANPEFLREGSAVHDFMSPDRVVIGATSAPVHDIVGSLYAGLDAPIIHSSLRSAELGKYATNAMLATRISFMNEIAQVCDATDADITEIERIVGTDRRIGPSFLKAGIGWGGSCFPKDVRALEATAADAGCSTPILDAVTDINARQRNRAYHLLRDAVAGMPSPMVAVLGLAFKPDTDDVRESPALDIIARLLEEGIGVRAHDPVAIANARQHLPQVTYCNDIYETVHGCDAVLLATEWPDYLAIDWHRVGAAMRGRTVLDGRNVVPIGALDGAGLKQLAFGRDARTAPQIPEDAQAGQVARA